MSSEARSWEVQQRSLGEVISEIKSEFKTFVQTRIEMLKEEISENAKAVKIAAPLFTVALALLGTSFLLFGVCLAALINVAFQGNPYGWFFSFLIISFLYAMMGAIVAYIGLGTLRNRSLLPRRTIKVLREDNIWLKSEARRSA
jgi:uncharacterized membrane protein YqjE